MCVFSISSTADQKMMMISGNSSPLIYLDLFTLLYFCPMKVYPIFITKIQPITTVYTFNQSASALSFLFTYEIPHNDIWVNVSNVPQMHHHVSPSYVQQVHKKNNDMYLKPLHRRILP